MSEAPIWIRDTVALVDLVSRIGAGPVAIDTEADSMHHYREKVCLLQVSFPGSDVLVDPLAGVDLSALDPLLGDPSTRKILHGADYDLRILARDHALSVRGVFDTMTVARLVGERAFGLAALLDSYLGIKMDKTHQRADWSRRPLPPAMVAYAMGDTRHLAELASKLESKLTELGRLAWAEEEFRRLEKVRWSTEEPDPEPFRRVKGSSALDRRRLAVLRELYAWRDGVAQSRDVPPFRVLRDEILLVIAKARPEEAEALASVPGLPRSLATGGRGREILEAVLRASSLPEDALPGPRANVRPKPDPELETKVGQLRIARDAIAEKLGLEPSVVASRAILESVVRARERGEAIETNPELRSWQAEILRPLVS